MFKDLINPRTCIIDYLIKKIHCMKSLDKIWSKFGQTTKMCMGATMD